MRRLYRFVIGFFALTGVLVVAGLGLGLWAALSWRERMEPALPSAMVLTLNLEGKIHDGEERDPLAALSGKGGLGLRELVMAIDAAAADKRVTALFASHGHAALGFASVQEVRDAVLRFRASGKPAILFAETLGEMTGGTLDTYLASAFGEIWLQPSGVVGLTGMLVETPFFKGTLDWLGILPQFGARHEYKSAIEPLTRTGFSKPARDSLDGLLASWLDQAVDGIAQGRRLPPATVRALIGQGPFIPSEAVSAGLVDKLGYRDQALAGLTATGAKPVEMAAYVAAQPAAKGMRVALISGLGAIHRGSGGGGFGESEDFGSATVAKAFRDAIDDPDVKAIVFRINSPGGSYTASDTVWNEVRRARAAGKPVVALLGDVAASGGYFVAMGADRIVAQPGSVTGSIGVFAGKMVIGEASQKLGISWDAVARGANAALFSPTRPFDERGWDRINVLLDAIYGDFTAKAAAGRKLSPDAIDAVARGRVWTGADAKAAGLVDRLGGWAAALDEVRSLTGSPPDQPVRLVSYPKPKKPWEKLASLLSGGEVEEGMRALARLAPLAAHMTLPDEGVSAYAPVGQPR